MVKTERIEIENRKENVPVRHTEAVESDLILLAALIYAEGSDEPREGKEAVASIVLNRSKLNKSIKEVIFEKNQFHGTRRKCFKERHYNLDCLNAATKVLMLGSKLDKRYIFFLNKKTAKNKQMLERLYNCPEIIEIQNHSFFY